MIFVIAFVYGLTFPNVRITLAALLEDTFDYLYDSAKRQNTFYCY